MLTVLMVLLEVKRDEDELEKKRSQLPPPSEMARYFTQANEAAKIQFSSTTGQQWLKDFLLNCFILCLDSSLMIAPLLFPHQAMSYLPQKSALRWLATTRLRVIAWTTVFREHLNIDIRGTPIDRATADGTWQTGPQFAFMAMSIEVKNEIGPGGTRTSKTS